MITVCDCTWTYVWHGFDTATGYQGRTPTITEYVTTCKVPTHAALADLLPTPRDTEPARAEGRYQLSAAFVEWMMGLPAGWVTDPAVILGDLR